MTDILATLSFMIFPLVITLLFTLLLPVLGSSLYIRNETVSAIALPPVAAAMLTIFVALGIPLEMEILLLILSSSAMALFFFIVLKQSSSPVQRQLILAALFIGGNGITRFVMSLSPEAEGNLSHILTGELLAIGLQETIIAAIFVTLMIFVFLIKKALFTSFILDEEILKLKSDHYVVILWIYRILTAFSVTLGVIFIGPLLTTGFLIFPALFGDLRKGSVMSYFRNTVFLALFSTLMGFLFAAWFDIPPAYVVTLLIPVVGYLLLLLFRKK